MINIRDLVENKEKYLKAFENRQTDLTDKVEEVISLQGKYLEVIAKENDLRAELNSISKEIGQDPKNVELKKKAGEISSSAKEMSNEAKELYTQMMEIASYFPNVPAEEVVVGKNEDDNVVIAEFDGVESSNKKPH